jgi:hypothetical protein
MSGRAQRFSFAAFIVLAASAAAAQSTWQPTAAPTVTAENTTWFQAGESIDWNGSVYHPAGAPEPFNAYQMVRSGSYRGIPLYTDSTLEPNSIVFVPLSGGRMKPYEPRRGGMLAGTVGSRTPSLPTVIPTEVVGTTGTPQALAPPTGGPVYDAATIPPPVAAPVAVSMMSVEPVAPPSAANPVLVPVGTTGTVAAAPAAAVVRPETTVVPPTGLNAIWIEFDGQRWYAAERSLPYEAAALNEIGTYRGWTVYSRKGEPAVIYVPVRPGHLAAYQKRRD